MRIVQSSRLQARPQHWRIRRYAAPLRALARLELNWSRPGATQAPALSERAAPPPRGATFSVTVSPASVVAVTAAGPSPRPGRYHTAGKKIRYEG